MSDWIAHYPLHSLREGLPDFTISRPRKISTWWSKLFASWHVLSVVPLYTQHGDVDDLAVPVPHASTFHGVGCTNNASMHFLTHTAVRTSPQLAV